MAAAATAVELHQRMSRFQGAGLLQERAWVQDAVGDLAKGGKFLLDAIATRTSHNNPSRKATAGKLGVRGDNESSKLKHKARAAVGADMDLSYNCRRGAALEDEGCSWETDPNGGWLSSFQ